MYLSQQLAFFFLGWWQKRLEVERRQIDRRIDCLLKEKASGEIHIADSMPELRILRSSKIELTRKIEKIGNFVKGL